jgi:N-methylhydantoinase A/oxoprolinase/acetone carboxylase beta subunit
MTTAATRLAVDIGGTFTDMVLERAGKRFTVKVLTTPRAPEEAVVAGTRRVLAEAGIGFADLDLLPQLGSDLPNRLFPQAAGARRRERPRHHARHQRHQPIRLVESGPAGSAILAAHVAAERGERKVLSFDMGGTTAKICLIEDMEPLQGRSFEVDRSARFLKGSGLPVRIPVIEMVEIGAGGGSLARVDELKRITVGPESAGSEPGPACYGRGGVRPTVTDADVALGRIDPERFAGGSIRLDAGAAEAAIEAAIGSPLSHYRDGRLWRGRDRR